MIRAFLMSVALLAGRGARRWRRTRMPMGTILSPR
jgi:hypothetical protein